MSCEGKCIFDGRNCNSNQWWNNGKCRCGCIKRHACEKDYVWNPAICNSENRKYLASIMDASAIMCYEIIESHYDKTNFNERKTTCETQNFYILHAFLLITITLLIAVSV